MGLRIKLMLILLAFTSITFVTTEYFDYKRDISEISESAYREATSFKALIMSSRHVYQQQFIASGLPLNDKTIGFLPAHALGRISSDMEKEQAVGTLFRNVTDHARNADNYANATELDALEFFRNHPEAADRIALFTSNEGKDFFHYSSPLWIEPQCLTCHGKKADAPKEIRSNYDSGFDYKIGDLRGILSIKIPIDGVKEQSFSHFKTHAVTNFFISLGGLLFVCFLLKKNFLNRIKYIQTCAHQISNGDYLQTIALPGNDEISQLANSIEIMTQSLINREKGLHESQERHRALLESLGVVVGQMDNNYSLRMGNKAITSLISKSLPEVLNKQCYQEFWGFEDVCPDCPGKIAMETEKTTTVEVERQNHDGEAKILKIIATPTFDTEQRVTGFTEVIEDITEEKEASYQLKELNSCLEQKIEQRTEQLQQANAQLQEERIELKSAHENLKQTNQDLKASQSALVHKEKMATIGQLAAGVAHEINNPIAYITSNLGSLSKYQEKLRMFIDTQTSALASLENDETKKEITQVRKKLKVDFMLEDGVDLIADSIEGATRVREIVQSLKTFSRVDEAEQKEVDINECLNSAISIIWNEIKYNCELMRDFGELPMLKCFPRQLSQVFMNLIINASHAIESHGQITLKTWTSDSCIFISIADNGCGIPEENLNKIFEPFFTTKEVGKGTGLGMSVVYEIVKKHQGEIHVESEVGTGTTFTIQLPIT